LGLGVDLIKGEFVEGGLELMGGEFRAELLGLEPKELGLGFELLGLEPEELGPEVELVGLGFVLIIGEFVEGVFELIEGEFGTELLLSFALVFS